MVWTVTSAVVAGLLDEARRAYPQECCGLLFGTDHAITAHQPAANVHSVPESRFEIDPQALIAAHRAMRMGGRRLVGYFHSHPSGQCRPSSTDRELAAGDGMIWAIVAADRVGLWRAGENGFSALSYTQV